MTLEEAQVETIKLFGRESFTEFDDGRYYVGALPRTAGPYQAFMGYSWEEALAFARESLKK